MNELDIVHNSGSRRSFYHQTMRSRSNTMDYHTKKKVKKEVMVMSTSSIIGGIHRTELRKEIEGQLNTAINRIFKEKKANKEYCIKKLHIRHDIYVSLLHSMREHRMDLCVIGSTLTGFDTATSDLDLCLIIYDENNAIDENYKHKQKAIEKLHNVGNILKMNKISDQVEVIKAKTPILKFIYNKTNIEVNININQTTSVDNSHLLMVYCKLDPRVRPLMIAVKTWAKNNGINNPFKYSLSSYSWTLMTIHFLQFGCVPPVLPCLHEKYPDLNQMITNRQLFARLNSIFDGLEFASQNQESVSSLLINFLDYYSFKVNYNEYIISIRKQRGLIPRANAFVQQTHRGPFGCVYIEEPFNLSNTAYSVLFPEVFDRIIQTMQNTSLTLKMNGASSLKQVNLC